jgi:glutaredoxin
LTVILYSTHCPRCNVLEKKLRQKNISYEEITDVNIMEQKGYLTVPILEVDGKNMDFKTANDWINSLE